MVSRNARLLAITLLRLKKMEDNLFSLTATVMLLRLVAVSIFNQKFLEVKAVKSTDHILSLKQLLTIITKTNLIVWYRFSTRQISENMLFITDFVLSIIPERAYVTMHGAVKIYKDNLKYLFLSIFLFFYDQENVNSQQIQLSQKRNFSGNSDIVTDIYYHICEFLTSQNKKCDSKYNSREGLDRHVRNRYLQVKQMKCLDIEIFDNILSDHVKY